jgi:hypothetical protein
MNTKKPGTVCADISEQKGLPGLRIVSLLAALALCVFSCTQAPQNNLPPKLEAEILTLMKDWHIPGMSICAIREGDIVRHRGLGVKNVLTGEPVNDETIFRAASISKPAFAYAVLRVCDEGLLNLDTPLGAYAPLEFIENTFLGHSGCHWVQQGMVFENYRSNGSQSFVRFAAFRIEETCRAAL